MAQSTQSIKPEKVVAKPQNALVRPEWSHTSPASGTVTVVETRYTYSPPTFFSSAPVPRLHGFHRSLNLPSMKYLLPARDSASFLPTKRPAIRRQRTPAHPEACESEHGTHTPVDGEGARRRPGGQTEDRRRVKPADTTKEAESPQARYDKRVKDFEDQLVIFLKKQETETQETETQEAAAKDHYIFLCWGKKVDCTIMVVPIDSHKVESQKEIWEAVRQTHHANRSTWRRFVPLLRVKNVDKVSVSRCAAQTVVLKFP
jgi:hypothetical protein